MTSKAKFDKLTSMPQHKLFEVDVCPYCGMYTFSGQPTDKRYKRYEPENKLDAELRARLKELGMCPRCYDDWQDECWCAACVSTTSKGREWCLCSQCEYFDGACPYPHKACGVFCESLPLIPKHIFDARMERGEI